MKVNDVLRDALSNTSSSHLYEEINKYLIEEYIITIDDLASALSGNTLNIPQMVSGELQRLIEQSVPTSARSQSPPASSKQKLTPVVELNSAYITPFIDELPVQKVRALRSPPAHKARGASLPLQLTRRQHNANAIEAPQSHGQKGKDISKNNNKCHSVPHSRLASKRTVSIHQNQNTSHITRINNISAPQHAQRGAAHFRPKSEHLSQHPLKSGDDGTGLSRTLNQLSRPTLTAIPMPSTVYSTPVLRSQRRPSLVSSQSNLNFPHTSSPQLGANTAITSQDLITIAQDLERRTRDAVEAIHHLHQQVTPLSKSNMDDISLLSPRSTEEEETTSVTVCNDQSFRTPDRTSQQRVSPQSTHVAGTVPREEVDSDTQSSCAASESESNASVGDVVEAPTELIDNVEDAAETENIEQEPEPWTETAGWMEYYTDEGDLYYYNHYTEESTWDVPPELVERRTMQAAVAHAVNICNVYHPIVVESEPVHDWHVDHIDCAEQRVYVTLPLHIRDDHRHIELPEQQEISQCGVNNFTDDYVLSSDSDSSEESECEEYPHATNNRSPLSESSTTSTPSPGPLSLRDSIRRRVAESLSRSTSRLHISCDSPIIEETDADLSNSDAASSATTFMENEPESNNEETSEYEGASPSFPLPSNVGTQEMPADTSNIDVEDPEDKETLSPQTSFLITMPRELSPPLSAPAGEPITTSSNVQHESDDDVSIFTYDGTITSDAESISRRRSGSFSDVSITPDSKKMKLTKRLKNLFRRKSLSSQTP